MNVLVNIQISKEATMANKENNSIKGFKPSGINISSLGSFIKNTPLEVLSVKGTKNPSIKYAVVGYKPTMKSYTVFIVTDAHLKVGQKIQSSYITVALSNSKNKAGFPSGFVNLTLRNVTVLEVDE